MPSASGRPRSRLDQLEHLAVAPARARRAVLARLDGCDLMILSYRRTGTTSVQWSDTPDGFAQDVLRGLDAAAAGRELAYIGPQHLRAARRPR
jgi:hypothetical protein